MDMTEYLSQLTVEEKAALCAGSDFWHTAAIKSQNIPSVMMTDGPHGLRRQKGKKPVGRSHPATCFPTAVTSACSFDRELLRQEGEAIGAEAKAQGVGLVLGPGLNIKRHPLCGRNFEYFSEDPCLAGELAAAFVDGVQSRGVGACLKHFACNSQEAGRMISNSLVDERALREIYLAGFETAVKKSRPMAVMGSYNKLNGTYACENKTLLTDILRDEWGFEGMTVTDWGAINDVVAAIQAGLDLEMPASGGERTKRLIDAVNDGRVSMDTLDRAAGNVLRFILAVKDNRPEPVEKDAHHELARRIARESAVLLKNDGLLPLDPEKPVSFIMRDSLRIQGEGSSQVNATDFTSPEYALEERGITYLRADGRNMDEASIAAVAAETVILFAGIPASDESEGFDRQTMALPEEQNRLIENVLSLNPRTVVVLVGGGVMELPWADRAGAILYMGLGGQAAGGAAIDLIFGDESPSGRLAETWPLKLSDCPAHPYFGGTGPVEYRESVFVGYRYYDTAQKEVRYPFGHGLSYTTFGYSNLSIDAQNLTVTVTVANLGDRAGKEVVQLYIEPPKSLVFRPRHELRDFRKIFLAPGEAQDVTFQLDERSFAFWNTRTHDWTVIGGTYTVKISASSRSVRLTGLLELRRPTPEIENYMTNTPSYYGPAREGSLSVPRWQFEYLLGLPIPREARDALTMNSTLTDAQDTPEGRLLLKAAKTFTGGESAMIDATLSQMPIRALSQGGLLKLSTLEKLVDRMNRSRTRRAEPLTPTVVMQRLKDRRAEKKSRKEVPPEELEELFEEMDNLLLSEADADTDGSEECPPEGFELPEPPKKKKGLRLPRRKKKIEPAAEGWLEEDL